MSTMKEAFPTRPTTLEGRPKLRGLLTCLKHIMSYAMLHRTHGLPLGKLYFLVGQEPYVLYTADPMPALKPDPGQVPRYEPGDVTTARAIVLNQFKIDYKRHHDKNTMDAALIERLQSMLDPEHAQTLREAIVSTPNHAFIATFAKAVQRWGHTTPSSRSANKVGPPRHKSCPRSICST